MSARITIDYVKIQNFRSIRNETIYAKDLNVFVGLNDVGKSNFLKALNLFFNNETDYGVKFDFEHDFSYLYPEKSHKAKQICIEVCFNVPDSYKLSGKYKWKKIWKATSFVEEEIIDPQGEKPSERSRVPSALKRIRYRYVPAVKSKDYYKALLADLYTTVSATINSPLEESIQSFADVLQEYTHQIDMDVQKNLGISSTLNFPEDLSEIFRNLIFNTAVEHTEKSVPLDKRGDGIQARHIPIILKYIADQDQKTRNRGSMLIHTIWGYEEPENGIELTMAYQLSENFLEYSSDIQMFVTSHSPAFYLISDNERCQVLYTVSSDRNEGTKIETSIDGVTIGKNMGIMPLVAPYIREKNKRINEYKRLLDVNGLADIPTIFVEGKTDITYIELAIRHFSPQLAARLDSGDLRIYSREAEGGCRMVENLVYAWIFSGNRSRCVALLDKDEAGNATKRNIESSDIYKNKRSISQISVKQISPSENIRALFKKKSKFDFEIEHLLSTSCWRELIARGWTERKPDDEIYKIVKPKMTMNMTMADAMLELDIPDEFVATIIINSPASDKKAKIADLVATHVKQKGNEWIEGFQKTIEMLQDIFER